MHSLAVSLLKSTNFTSISTCFVSLQKAFRICPWNVRQIFTIYQQNVN